MSRVLFPLLAWILKRWALENVFLGGFKDGGVFRKSICGKKSVWSKQPTAWLVGLVKIECLEFFRL